MYMSALSKQDLHNLAMNIIGKKLEEAGFEFLAVNSLITRHPQFVCVNADHKKFFILVKAVTYPEQPEVYDPIWMKSVILQAKKFDAHVWFAGVGLAKATAPEELLTKEDDFILNFKGFKKIC